MNSKLLVMLVSLLILQACRHPLEIVGEGDIIDLKGILAGCTLEQFRAKSPLCAENDVKGDYFPHYAGVPRPGWRFVRWDGPCAGNSSQDVCRIDAPASFSSYIDTSFPDTPMPAAIAVFEPIPSGESTISGLLGRWTLILVDEQGSILDVASAFNRDPDADFNGDGVNEAFTFTFGGLPIDHNFRLYLITEDEVYTVFGDNDGDGLPNSNVFSFSETTSIDLGVVGWSQPLAGQLLAQFELFSHAAVVAEPADQRMPIGIERPPLAGLSAEQLVQSGLAALSNGWAGGANAYFERAVISTEPGDSPAADSARFFLAFTSLTTLLSETASDGDSAMLDRIGDVLDLLQVPDDALRGSLNWVDLPDELNEEHLSGEQLTEFIDQKITNSLNRSTELLAQVSPDFNTNWSRADSSDLTESDYGDAQFFLGALNLLRSLSALAEAYDTSFDAENLLNSNNDEDPTNDDTVESFLDKNPDFLSLADRSELARASDLLVVGAINSLQAALSSIEAETDPQDDDLIRITSLDESEITRTRSYLTNIKRSVEVGETLIEADSDGDQRKDLILDLQRFFTTGVDFRADGLLPAVSGNDLDKSNPCLPDPSFNGVVVSPDLDALIYDEATCN